MLTQTDLERERYEARRKAQLDHNTLMNAARREGLKEGRVEGRVEGRKLEKISLIHFCEQILKRPQTPQEQLISLPLEELNRLAEELQALCLKSSSTH